MNPTNPTHPGDILLDAYNELLARFPTVSTGDSKRLRQALRTACWARIACEGAARSFETAPTVDARTAARMNQRECEELFETARLILREQLEDAPLPLAEANALSAEFNLQQLP